MADTKVSALTATTAPVSSDIIYIVDGGASRQSTLSNISKGIVTTNLDVTGLTVSQLLRTNAGGTAIESSGKTVPTGDIVGTTDTQTLTNKTLKSPIITDSTDNTVLGISGSSTVDTYFTIAGGNAGTLPVTVGALGHADAELHIFMNSGDGKMQFRQDGNIREMLILQATASAINEITITNAAIGNNPSIAATGNDTNIDISIKGKNTGGVKLGTGTVSVTDVVDQDDMSDDSAVKLSTQQSIKAYIDDGWNFSTDTWVYVSATTFKIEGKDVTATFPTGTKLKLTQTTIKYFYVVTASFSTDTTITVTGGDDYTLANAAITLPNYSYVSRPQGFPSGFTLPAPTWSTSGSGFTNDPGSWGAAFWMEGSRVIYRISAKTNATSGGTGNFIMTFASGILPPVNSDGGGKAQRTASATIFGFTWTQAGIDDVIKINKYDGTEIVGSNLFFGGNGWYDTTTGT